MRFKNGSQFCWHVGDLRCTAQPCLDVSTSWRWYESRFERRMSLIQHRSSPSTVQFTYSVQPSSRSFPNVASTLDLLSALCRSAVLLLFAQWSTTRLYSNRIIGPLLRYIGGILPYHDVRFLQMESTPWRLSAWGVIAILCFALLLFYCRMRPLGKAPLTLLILMDRGIIPHYKVFGCTNDESTTISSVQLFEIYSRVTNRRCISLRRDKGNGSTVLSWGCSPWRRNHWSGLSGMSTLMSVDVDGRICFRDWMCWKRCGGVRDRFCWRWIHLDWMRREEDMDLEVVVGCTGCYVLAGWQWLPISIILYHGCYDRSNTSPLEA